MEGCGGAYMLGGRAGWRMDGAEDGEARLLLGGWGGLDGGGVVSVSWRGRARERGRWAGGDEGAMRPGAGLGEGGECLGGWRLGRVAARMVLREARGGRGAWAGCMAVADRARWRGVGDGGGDAGEGAARETRAREAAVAEREGAERTSVGIVDVAAWVGCVGEVSGAGRPRRDG